ncbi:YadA-like family protein, partial [uncultured Megasphaera sp.]|uniref:YadA-like family protein n=1 Tax=uncultured Megasphaera sp. TaxID=165188 RepID=UPI00262E3277
SDSIVHSNDNGGIAIGEDSVTGRDAGKNDKDASQDKAGYDATGKQHARSDKDYAIWVSTDAAVSVGGADREVKYKDKEGKDQTKTVKSTRQITNLAAGLEDTDAVNVAQLKASAENLSTTINATIDKKVAVVFDDKSSLMSTDAEIKHEILQDLNRFPEGEGQSIALGKGASAWMQGGSKASYMLFGMKKAAGAIAIGEGSQALSQSIDIGNRTYTGDIGDVTISKYWNWGSGSGVGSVLLGTNSYTGGTLSTLIGDYSIMSTAYPYAYDSHYGSYTQNAGAVSIGALNSIESATSDNSDSGIANSIVGLANKTNNANGALIYGAGNTITNSFADVATPGSAGSAAKAAQSFRDSVQKNPGGAALAIGGGNAIDRSIRSQVIGVNNTLTGNTYHKDWYWDGKYHPAVDGVSSQYNMIDGYNNTAQNVNHAYVIGANNIIQGKKFSDATKNGVLNDADWEKSQQDDNLIVIGDNHTLANDVANDIILGTADKTLTTSVSNVVMIGHNADAQKEGGVALGADSVASVDKDVVGYDPSGIDHSGDTTGVWKSKAAAVSVGRAEEKDKAGNVTTPVITRQITNVAAGKELTDAVNVAQLKSAQIHYYSMNPKSDAATGANSNYNNDGATGDDAIAIGPFASAEGSHSLALGYSAKTPHSDVKPLADEDGYDDNTAVGYKSQAGYRSTALGYRSQANGGRAVALGTDALADKDNSTAVGMNAQATGKQATALGSLAKASGESATAVGEGANALADYSSAVGQGAIVEAGAFKGTALGYQAKVLKDAENSIALGASSQVSGANSIAIGMSAQVSGAKSVAIGQDAKVFVENSVALGQGSVASGNLNDYNVMSLTIPNLGSSYGVSGGYPSGIVSVGNDKKVRTITNVAAGRVTPTSTDAVNGSELYDVATEAAKHATVKAAAKSRITVDKKEGVNKGKGIEYTIGLNTDGLAALTDGLTFAGDDGQSDNSKIISRKLNEQLNIIGGATDIVNAANIGVIRTADNTLNVRLAKDITGLNSLQATTVTSGNVTVDGQHDVITGLSNTTWDKTKDYSQSTKAATEAQIQQAMTQAADNANDTHIKAGDYAVSTVTDKDGKKSQGVALDIVDKTGTSVGKVTITDVAKASDVGDVTGLNTDIKNAEGKTTVVDAVNHVDNKVGNLDYSSTKYVKKGEDVTTSIGKLDEAIKNASEAAGKHTIVSTKDSNLSVKNIAKEGEAANYQISLNKDLNVDSVTAKKIATKDLEATGSATIGKVTINADDKGTIGGLTNTTWDAKNITSGQAATEDQLQAATKNAVNYDGDDSKTVTLREDTTIKNVANTTIEEGSKNAVNAGTVYNETRVAKDGNFIRQANTAGENLTALDHQVAANAESIYHINNRVSNLDNRVNKVGAGAAALAALHPLDFDPDDKWDFAVGYGNYRNANSVAFGAFYRPNEDTMFSLGTNFGNGENMFNAGLSFKIGQGGSGITTSKTAMAKTISSLKDTVHKQDQKIEGLENVVDTQDKKIAELEALVKEQGEMIRQYVGKK